MLEKKKILFAVLNWGLGHATRSWELIHKLSEEGNEVILASDGVAKIFLEQEFPELKVYGLPSYNIQYGKRSSIFAMLKNGVKTQIAVRKEKVWLREFLKKNKIDQIISDNRYGIYSGSIHSIIVTHQINIKTLFGSILVNAQNHKWLNNFNEIWVPDINSELSGELSTPIPKKLASKVKQIGWLSRFKQYKNNTTSNELIVAIVSGPEPQKSILAETLKKILSQLNTKSVLYLGSPEVDKREKIGNLIIKPHASTAEFGEDLAAAKVVVSRSGYSSLMDYKILNKKMLLIPTPGQDEQIYLGKHLSVNSGVTLISQKNLNFVNFKSAVIDFH